MSPAHDFKIHADAQCTTSCAVLTTTLTLMQEYLSRFTLGAL